MKTKIRTTVTLERKADAELIDAAYAYGLRRLARATKLSPSFLSRVLNCQCSTPIVHVERMKKIVGAGT